MLGRLSILALVAVFTLSLSGTAFGNDDVKVRHVRGKVVRVDPTKNIIVVRTINGTTAEDVEYVVADTTKYWGPDRVIINDGIKYKGFREGTELWYLPGTQPNNRTLSEVRFFDPTVPVPNPK